jgi:hypothetical protein
MTDDDNDEIIARVRALPQPGKEPDWDAFERDVRRAVAAMPTPRARRRWRWPVLGIGLAAAVAASVLVLTRAPRVEPREVAIQEPDARAAEEPVVPPAAPVRPPSDPSAPLALGDGVIAVEELDAIDPDLLDGEREEEEVARDDEAGLVPDLELDWLDALDDAELDAVEAWLDEEAG